MYGCCGLSHIKGYKKESSGNSLLRINTQVLTNRVKKNVGT